MVRDPLPGLRTASVYGRGRTYVVASSRRAGYGPGYRSPPYLLLPDSATDEQLGQAIVTALDGFVLMAEPPSGEVMDAATAELLGLVGVASERTFERGASLVHVTEQRGRWSIEPWDRRRGYWVPLDENTHAQLSSPSPAELGEETRKAFVRLRGRG